MIPQQQELRSDFSPSQVHKRFHQTRWLIVSIALLLVAVSASIWILVNRSTLIAVLPLVIFAVLGVLIALFQWLFPFSSPPSAPPPGEVTLLTQASYRRIVGFPPLTDPRAIQQREQVVKAVYAELTQPDTTAVVLTGIGGVGKSTLAALVYRYAEERRAMRTGPFVIAIASISHSLISIRSRLFSSQAASPLYGKRGTWLSDRISRWLTLRSAFTPFLAQTLWLTVDSTVTFVDLMGTILELLGTPIPPLGNQAPHSQALTLFNALNATGKPLLIIFDQFENLLNPQTGHALADRPGVGEWLDIINSQPCRCRFLLTSRPRPLGIRESPPAYLQEYSVEGLDIAEGVALLRSRGVNGTEEELQIAVRHCNGHALSLSLLASLIHEYRLSLTILVKDPTFWRDDIAQKLLDYLYTKQLNHIQRALLVAFSVFREPVLLEAAEALITDAPRSHLLGALQALRVQHLIEPTGNGHYQPHTIIAEYAREHVDESNKLANKEALKALHWRAAQQYQRQAEAGCPPLEGRRTVSDIHDLVEAIWHSCRAEQWQAAYGLVERERVFRSLQQWGSNAILLELCSLFQPQGNWSPTPSQAGAIHRYMAWAYNALGRREPAREHNEEALRLYRESGNLEGQERILDALGWSCKAAGKMKQAEEYYQRALAICKTRVDRQGEGHVLNGLGQVYDIQGRREQAQECFQQALALCKEVGDSRLEWRRIEGRALSNLGYIHTDLGHYIEALGYLKQALAIRKNIGDRRGEGVAHEFSGRAYRERGREHKGHGRVYQEQEQEERAAQEFKQAMQDFERAIQEFREALSIYRTIGDRGLEGWALHNLGWTYNASGQYERARNFLEQALPIRQEVGDRRGESRTTRDLGESSSRLGQNKQALAYYQQALIISEEIPDPYGKGTILQNAASVYIDQARYDVALSCLLIAKRIFDDLHSPYSKEAQERIDTIQKQIGKEQFTALLAGIEFKTQQIAHEALLASGDLDRLYA